MDDAAFKKAYGEFRNGSNQQFRHSLVPLFLYTDGVRDCAIAGVYWLLNIVATETRDALIALAASGDESALAPHQLKAVAADGKVDLTLEGYDKDGEWAEVWRRGPISSDMTEGEWTFNIGALNYPSGNCRDLGLIMCLPSED